MAALTPVFGAINRVVAPALERGFLRVPPLGAGPVLLQVVGRRTGAERSVPLLAARVGDHLVVSTIRASSAWVRNLEADEHPAVVLNGQRRPVRARVHRRGPAIAHLALAG